MLVFGSAAKGPCPHKSGPVWLMSEGGLRKKCPLLHDKIELVAQKKIAPSCTRASNMIPTNMQDLLTL